MTRPSLAELLLKSDSCTSLAHEQRIVSAMRKHGFRVTHSAYFKDQLTGKHREVDILASKTWVKMIKSGPLYMHLEIPIEVKSMDNYHIIISSEKSDGTHIPRQSYWLPIDDNKFVETTTLLQRAGRPDPHIREVIRLAERTSFPRHRYLVYHLMPNPFELDSFTSFRETNIQKEKDLDASVLWRGSQSLRSATHALKNRAKTIDLQNIEDGFDYNSTLKSVKPVDDLFWIQEEVKSCSIFHPLLVLNASLWKTGNESIEETFSARFNQAHIDSDENWWCDICTSQNFNNFIKDLSTYYAKQMSRAKATPY